MKIKFIGFIDNTYKELKTIEVYNVMGISLNADDGFLNVSYFDGELKSQNFTSLQWAKGLEVFPS